ncbi:MAG TPA: FAD-dependent oxidoreductase [Candidatus Sulfotelmatobacter sp.]|nr:FAD-dependent oxidoreductase [Candidatus Sulfotelmatobacter sp.]
MITVQDVRRIPLFAGLPDPAASRVAANAADIRLRANEYFVGEGETPAFYVVLDGRMEILKRYGSTVVQLAERGPGEYVGETPILLGTSFFVSARTLEPTRLLRLEAQDFRWLLRVVDGVREQILEVVSQRTQGVSEETSAAPAPPIVLGSRYDERCHDVRDFLARNRIAFEWFDPADGACTRYGDIPRDQLPMLILPDGTKLSCPSPRQMAQALGLQTDPDHAEYDVTIVGGGPAGLAAAVYGASEGLRTLLIENFATGGQAGTSSRIENYLGFPSGLSGDDLADRARTQAERLGAEIIVARAAQRILPGSPLHTIELDGDVSVQSHAVVLATGVSYRKLQVPDIDRFLGTGVFYGAARSEASTTTGRDVVLVGGGNSAGQAAMFFSGYARKVTVLIRGASLNASMSHYLIEELATRDNIEIRTFGEIVAVYGREHLEGIDVRDPRDGSVEHWAVDAVFVFIGADAYTDWLPTEVIRDERGYVCTGRDVRDLLESEHRDWPNVRDPFLLESSVPGIFAAGDVRHGSVKRVAAGVGEGSMTIAFVHQYLASLPQAAPV